MKKWLMAVLFITALVLAACGGASDDNATDETADDATEEQAGTDDATTEEGADDSAAGDSVDVAAGEDVYKTSCAACHGADLSGGVGPELTTIGSKYSADEIANIVTEGIGTMPAQSVAGEDLDNLSNWLAEKQ